MNPEGRDPELDEIIKGEIEALRAIDKERSRMAADLYTKARALVTLLDDAEVNHGGLWSGKTMRARDDLRLELARWR
jgi:hypothetical protein